MPDVVRAVCTTDGVSVETPTAAPQLDGLHVEIVNETDAERSFSLSGDVSGLGFAAPPGTTEEVVDLGPGALTVGCDDPATEPSPASPSRSSTQRGSGSRPSSPAGSSSPPSSTTSRARRARRSDPLEAARKAVEGYGLEPDDVFEPAGYPEAAAPAIRLVRDGEPLAVVHLMDDGQGEWLVGTVTGCSSLGEG